MTNDSERALPSLPPTLDQTDPRWRKAYELRIASDWEEHHAAVDLGAKLTWSNFCRGCWHPSCSFETFQSWAANRARIGTLVGVELEALNG